MQTQTAQSESATAVSQHAAVMSLNLKLQSSAAKNQARQIEHELIKIQARESKELYDIVKVGVWLPIKCFLRRSCCFPSRIFLNFTLSPIWRQLNVTCSSSVWRRKLTSSTLSLHKAMVCPMP